MLCVAVCGLRTVLACRPPVSDFCFVACPVPGPAEAGASALRLSAPTFSTGAGEELAGMGLAVDIVLGKGSRSFAFCAPNTKGALVFTWLASRVRVCIVGG